MKTPISCSGMRPFRPRRASLIDHVERNSTAAGCLMRGSSKFTTISLFLSTRMNAKSIPASTVSRGYLKHPYHPDISLKDIYLLRFSLHIWICGCYLDSLPSLKNVSLILYLAYVLVISGDLKSVHMGLGLYFVCIPRLPAYPYYPVGYLSTLSGYEYLSLGVGILPGYMHVTQWCWIDLLPG